MAVNSDPVTVYQQLLDHYGPQHWWPAESPFEVMVGAILTQNTSWSGVEKAIANLRSARLLTPQKILACPPPQLGELIRPSGYYNLKSARLKNYSEWYLQHRDTLPQRETASLRDALLQINGVGPETADDILLYAFRRPVFVVDAYTRRIFQRLGWLQGGESYEQIRLRVESRFARRKESEQVEIYSELHGLVVNHAKQHCKKSPDCSGCPLVQCPEKRQIHTD